MRKLRFRAYDTIDKEWLFGYKRPKLGGFSLVGEVVLCGELNSVSLERWNDIDIMQFTGLKDRKRVDIYEGDIVKEYIMGDLFQIVFTDYANFGLKPVSKKAVKLLKGHEYETIDPSYASTSLTVVGNIYDTTKLLKN